MYVEKECVNCLKDDEKIEVLNNIWQPLNTYKFPLKVVGQQKRKFNRNWLDRYSWLAYSELKAGAFCKFCVLFFEPKNFGHSQFKVNVLINQPCTNYKKALEIINNHEVTKYHNVSVLSAENMAAIVKNKKKMIIDLIDQQKNEQILKNREILGPIIDTIRLCGRQGIAMRGHDDSGRIKLNEPAQNDGNFRVLIRYRATTDSTLKNHLLNSKQNAMYTSCVIQNEIVSTFAQKYQQNIIDRVKASKYFTVLADETTDISTIEQFSLCIRYIDESDTNDLKIREDFLKFIPVTDTTGAGLAKTIIDNLSELGLNTNDMRGQGYDGAAAMRGQFNGVQSIIRQQCPKAIYTHCVAHCLNLCISDASTVPEIRNAFNTISEICNFFHRSAQRTDLLKSKILFHQPNARSTKLKTLCETRWVLRHEALQLFKEFFIPIVATLEELKDRDVKANTLFQSVCKIQFIFASFVATDLMQYTKSLSSILQSENSDLIAALKHIEDVQVLFTLTREKCDEKFHAIYQEVEKICEKLNIEVNVPRVCGLQTKRNNVPHANAEDYYKRSLYLPYLDYVTTSLNDRFGSHKAIIKSLQYLVPHYCASEGVNYSSIEEAVSFYVDDIEDEGIAILYLNKNQQYCLILK